MTERADAPIGSLFECIEQPTTEALADIGPYVVVVNDPPWSALAPSVPAPLQQILAGDMELEYLDSLRLTAEAGEAGVVVGLGGGTALDTAKYVAWKHDLPLVQIPTITSVDAGFTDAIGVRVGGNVRYIGKITPRHVVLDIDLIASAPKRLNRAGIGDILSCHTGLHDWRSSVAAGHPPPWDDRLANLGARLLIELEDALDDVANVTPAGVRFLADAYRRIGAACAAAGHSRFEEGSEHFWAYAYESRTGAHHVHGELIACATVALAHVQQNDPDFAHRIVSLSKAVAHPADLDIEREVFVETLVGLRRYAREQSLDIGVADLIEITPERAHEAWTFVASLPRTHDG